MTTPDIAQRITDYLAGGGLFNPEQANHDAVRDLVIDCRNELERLRAQVAQPARYFAETESGKVYAFQQRDSADDCVRDMGGKVYAASPAQQAAQVAPAGWTVRDRSDIEPGALDVDGPGVERIVVTDKDSARAARTLHALAAAMLAASPAQQAGQAPAPAPHTSCQYCDGTGDVHRADGEWLGECNQCPAAALHAFKNFHRLLCERFGYSHDEKDWRRDQLSLIEFIAAKIASPAVTHGSDMLEPLIYAAMMHNGKPKTVAEFERVAANVADMLQRRAADAHEKPVASIYISADGSREFDDWRVDLPPGNHQLFTAPRPAQPQPESLPHPGAPEAEEMIDKLLAEYNRPANMKNAARAGYMAARRLLQNARQPLPAVEDAEPIGWGGVIETCAELCDPHFIAQQDLDELKRYAGNWNSTYRFFPIYAPGAQLTEGPAVLAERDALKAAIVELNAAEFAYARYIRSDGLEKHRQNRERRIAAWQAARKLVGADGSNVPVQNKENGNG